MRAKAVSVIWDIAAIIVQMVVQVWVTRKIQVHFNLPY